jgi:hypothetical protein
VEAVRDSAIGLRLTLECGYKIFVDLDFIQAHQAEIHHEDCWSSEIPDINGSVLKSGEVKTDVVLGVC